MTQANMGFDPSVPSPARVWNYWIGGKDNFAADRAVGDRVLDVLPEVAVVARLTRGYLRQTVETLAGEYGIRQFLDIGSGLPTADNTHQVAQRVARDARVVYADNDPVVIRHATALLDSTPAGRCDYIEADLRDTDAILQGAARTLDFNEPIAVLLFQVLHFIPDDDDPHKIVSRLMAGVAPGSYLVIVHASSDVGAEVGSEIQARYNQMMGPQVRMRSRDEVARFFDGLEMTGEGLISGRGWTSAGATRHAATSGISAQIRLGAGAAAAARLADSDGMSFGHAGMARKPLCAYHGTVLPKRSRYRRPGVPCSARMRLTRTGIVSSMVNGASGPPRSVRIQPGARSSIVRDGSGWRAAKLRMNMFSAALLPR
jgi:O-methyltransferase involved in polyketide biosynthesis